LSRSGHLLRLSDLDLEWDALAERAASGAAEGHEDLILLLTGGNVVADDEGHLDGGGLHAHDIFLDGHAKEFDWHVCLGLRIVEGDHAASLPWPFCLVEDFDSSDVALAWNSLEDLLWLLDDDSSLELPVLSWSALAWGSLEHGVDISVLDTHLVQEVADQVLEATSALTFSDAATHALTAQGSSAPGSSAEATEVLKVSGGLVFVVGSHLGVGLGDLSAVKGLGGKERVEHITRGFVELLVDEHLESSALKFAASLAASASAWDTIVTLHLLIGNSWLVQSFESFWAGLGEVNDGSVLGNHVVGWRSEVQDELVWVFAAFSLNGKLEILVIRNLDVVGGVPEGGCLSHLDVVLHCNGERYGRELFEVGNRANWQSLGEVLLLFLVSMSADMDSKSHVKGPLVAHRWCRHLFFG